MEPWEIDWTDEDLLAQRMAESGNRDYTDTGKPIISEKGAKYAMQVLPSTAGDPGYGVEPARYDAPEEYNRVGEDYIKVMKTRYGDDDLGYMAYNWGPDNVDKWVARGSNPEEVPRETRDYLQNIKKHRGSANVSGGGVGNPWDLPWGEDAQAAGAAKQPWDLDWDSDAVKKPMALERGFREGMRGIGETTASTLEAIGQETGIEGIEKFGTGLRGKEDKPQRDIPTFEELKKDPSLGRSLTFLGESLGQGAASTLPSLAGGVAGIPAGPVGIGVGAGIPAAVQNYGDIRDQLRSEGVDDRTANGISLLADIPITALDVFSVGGLFKAFGKDAIIKAGVGELIKRFGKEGLKGATREGVTEAMQQGIQEYVAAETSGNPDEQRRWSSILDAGIQGGITGGVMQAPAGLRGRTEAPPQEEAQPEPEEVKALEPPRMISLPNGSVVSETEAFNLGITPEMILAARAAEERAPKPAPEVPEPQKALPAPRGSGIFIQHPEHGVVEISEAQADRMRENIKRMEDIGLTPDVMRAQQNRGTGKGEPQKALPPPRNLPDVFVSDSKGGLRQATTTDITEIGPGQITPRVYRSEDAGKEREVTPVAGETYKVVLPNGSNTQAIVTGFQNDKAGKPVRAVIATEDGRNLRPLVSATKFIEAPRAAELTKREFKPEDSTNNVRISEPSRNAMMNNTESSADFSETKSTPIEAGSDLNIPSDRFLDSFSGNDTSGFESPPDTLVSNTNDFADLRDTKALFSQGYSSLDAPSKLRVLKSVLLGADDPKIFKSIVMSIPVDVMNDLAGKEFSPDALFHNSTVFKDALSINANLPIGARAMEAAIRSPAFSGAKILPKSHLFVASNKLKARKTDKNSLHGANDIHPEEKVKLQTIEPMTGISSVQRIEQHTPETEGYLTQLQEHVKKVMGKNAIGLDLVGAIKDKEGKYAEGAFSPQHKMAYVALNGSDGMRNLDHLLGTTRHEVIHALRNSGLFMPEEWSALQNAAEKKWLKQYNIGNRYKGLDREAQLEEAIAEAYADKNAIKDGPFLKRVFDKIKQFFDAVKDFIQGSQVRKGEKVLKSVEKGELAERTPERTPSPQEAKEIKFQRERFDESVKSFGKDMKAAGDAIKKGAVPGSNLLKTFLYASDDHIRSIAAAVENDKGRKAMEDEVNKWSARSGEAAAVKETYEEAVESHTNSLINRLQKILGDHVENLPVLNKAVQMVQNPTTLDANTPAGRIAVELTRLINNQLKYMQDAGMGVKGQVGYFPRVYDEEKILQNTMAERKFVKDATQAYQLDPNIGPAEALDRAEAWLENIKFGENSSIMKFGGGSNIPNFVKARELGKDADNIMREWLEQDPRVIMANYITRSTRRAEFVRRVGEDNEQWKETVKQLNDNGADYAVPLLQDYIATVAGVQPKGKNYGINSMLSWVRTWGTIGLLERSTLTSLPEFISPAIRSGNLLDVGRSLSGAIADLIGKSKDAKELTQDLGLIVSSLSPTIQASRFGGGDPVGKLQQRILNKYFPRIGLEQWTNATRVSNTRLGQVFLRRLASKIKYGSTGQLIDLSERETQALLSELGIDKKDAKGFADWLMKHEDGMPEVGDLKGNDAYTKAYRTALVRFVNQGILVPKVSMKPKWANSPLGGVIFHLQAYNYAFQKQVINRVINLARENDLTALERARLIIPTVAIMPLLTAAAFGFGDLRDKVFGGPEGGRTEGEKWLLAFDRSLTGAFSPLINLITSTRYNRDIATSLAGPALGNVFGAAEAGLKALGDNSDKTNTAERRLAKAFYDVGIEPSVNFFLAALPVGLTSAAITQAVGAPVSRETFVSAIAGNPDDRIFRQKIYTRLQGSLEKIRDSQGPSARKSAQDEYDSIIKEIVEHNKSTDKPIKADDIRKALHARIKKKAMESAGDSR